MKKGLVATDAMVWLLIAVFTFLVLIFIIPNLLGKGGSQTSEYLSSTSDYDKDGIANFFDKCVCASGSEENDGCPTNSPLEGDVAIQRENECKKRISNEQKDND